MLTLAAVVTNCFDMLCNCVCMMLLCSHNQRRYDMCCCLFIALCGVKKQRPSVEDQLAQVVTKTPVDAIADAANTVATPSTLRILQIAHNSTMGEHAKKEAEFVECGMPRRAPCVCRFCTLCLPVLSRVKRWTEFAANGTLSFFRAPPSVHFAGVYTTGNTHMCTI